MTDTERLRMLDKENEELRDMLNQVAWRLGLGDEVHYYSGDNYLACQLRVLDAIESLTELEADAMGAWRWVCERGGLENVRDAWDEAVNLCATIGCEPNDESEMLQALGDCTDIVIKRLMPEGMEWPCFEDGEPVRIGDEVITHNVWQTSTVTSISLYDGGSSVYYRWCGKDNGASVSGKYVKRPTPKVLDADGEPLEVGQTVWSVNDGIGPLVVKMLPSEGEQLVVLDNDGTNFYRYPEKLTHKRPDSWERIEEDAKKDRCSYFRAKYQDCGRCTQLATSCSISKAFDLVRRCRALAERDR